MGGRRLVTQLGRVDGGRDSVWRRRRSEADSFVFPGIADSALPW